ncbi:tubulin polyglutamylase complex subunit 1-like [Clavelina lepadiformis]|uniref:tubulin polyglutamylase complex subunit 1-like n=1 Tax=Clavelina lepadiformis TaxID=159417 RepID=UPI00404175E3
MIYVVYLTALENFDMTDKRKELLNSFDGEKKQVHMEYMQKSELLPQIRKALLKLIENKPSEPMLFLANYFDSVSSNDKTDKIANAMQVLQLTNHRQAVFQTNLMIAFDMVSVARNASSKKAVNKRPGLTGSVYEDLLKAIGTKIPKDIFDELFKQIGCRPSEMVPFDIFRYGVTVCYVCIDFINLCGDIFQTFCNKVSSDIADKYICDFVIDSFKNVITTTSGMQKCEQPAAVLEAGYMLCPDKLAIDLLNGKDDKCGKSTMSRHDFLCSMCQTFFSKIKSL